MNVKTDFEWLELAAKAVGYVPYFYDSVHCGWRTEEGINYRWNPLADDGDALRLVVKLGIQVSPGFETNRFVATVGCGQVLEERRPDAYAATRRAIVRAAAEIGESK